MDDDTETSDADSNSDNVGVVVALFPLVLLASIQSYCIRDIMVVSL